MDRSTDELTAEWLPRQQAPAGAGAFRESTGVIKILGEHVHLKKFIAAKDSLLIIKVTLLTLDTLVPVFFSLLEEVLESHLSRLYKVC